jgi:hypothetical protein
MGYCAASGGNLLWVIGQLVVVIFYGLMGSEWW